MIGTPLSLAVGMGLVFSSLAVLLYIVMSGVARPSAKSPTAERIGSLTARFIHNRVRSRYERMLLLAGSPRDMSLEALLGIKTLAAPIGVFAGIAVAGYAALTPAFSLIITFVLAALGFFLPDIWLARKASKRQDEIRRALPDTIELLTISVESGLGFSSALQRISRDTKGPLSEEISRLLREIQLGRSRQEAFRAMMDRTNVDELNSFIVAIIEADIYGIAVGKTLRAQSTEMRKRRRQKAEEMAMKVPVKIIFPVVLFIFPAIFVVVAGPAGIHIFRILSSSS